MTFNQIMIKCSAPTLCDIKPANLFFVKNQDFSEGSFEEWKDSFFKLGLMCFKIKLSKDSTAILVCNVCWERKLLEDPVIQAYLSGKGYQCKSVFDFVKEFSFRVQKNTGFPHEVGVILGYPVEDVIEFENHQGHDCKYCGQWKSYSNVENARECHYRYKSCCGFCERLYSEGYSLDYIICQYKKMTPAA